MGFTDLIRALGEKQRQRKELARQMEEQVRIKQMIEDKQKSANERELERFMKEEREEHIKEELAFYRKKRKDEIAFGHNPLNIKNITNHTDWEVLKERNLFAGKGNMFSNEATVMKNNPNLMKNNMRLLR